MTAVTMTGADFKRFYNDEETWANGVYHDDDEILLDGKPRDDKDLNAIDDATVVEIRGGDVLDNDDDFVCSFPDFAKRWIDKQTTTTLVVKVEKDKVAAVRAAIEAAGGTLQ